MDMAKKVGGPVSAYRLWSFPQKFEHPNSTPY